MASPVRTSPSAGRALRGERGQAAIELVAALPGLLLAGLLCLQLLATGYARTLADGAAEAGAIAIASGSPPREAAMAAVPGWARDRISVAVGESRVVVRLRPPSPLPPLADALEVSSSAWALAPAEGPAA